jgi:hypothetical protein
MSTTHPRSSLELKCFIKKLVLGLAMIAVAVWIVLLLRLLAPEL